MNLRIWNKNTIDFEEFKFRDIAIHCDTKEKAIDLLTFLDNNNVTWCDDGDKLLNDMNYKEYLDETCYIYDYLDEGLQYSPLDFFIERGYEIVEWETSNESQSKPSVIFYEKLNRSEFKKKIYISHSYCGKHESIKSLEIKDIERKIKKLIKKYPDYLFISPTHTFGFLYDDVNYKVWIDSCLELLKTCDEIWVIDKKDEMSKNVIIEREYAVNNNIPIYLVEC